MIIKLYCVVIKKRKMTIQLNADNHITLTEKFREILNAQLSAELHRFSEHITRIEVHLADENGDKKGLNDKRCTIEARIEGRQPIAVTSHANSTDQAVNVAIDKLISSLDTIFDRIKSH